MTSYYRSIVTVGLFRTVSKNKGDIRRKSPIFRIPVYLAPPMKGFPLELGIGAMDLKSSNDELPDGRKKI